jgi:hypothetical protein
MEIFIENQELDNVTKLQLVQPLLFGDIMLSSKNKAVDTWTLLQVSVVGLLN